MAQQIWNINCPPLPQMTQVKMRDILLELCQVNDVAPHMVKGSSRMAQLVDIRAEFCRRCMGITSNSEIGAFIGRDHSAVNHYLNHKK